MVFSPTLCKIKDSETYKVKGEGLVSNGLYHLSNQSSAVMSTKVTQQCLSVNKSSLLDQYTLWHNRLGHAPISKLKYIECVSPYTSVSEQVCLTCPMAKFVKLPFSASESCASKAFELIHTDIWGPYKVPTRKKFKYFLTIVDDYSRMTWIYLLQHKSDFLKTLEMFHCFVQK